MDTWGILGAANNSLKFIGHWTSVTNDAALIEKLLTSFFEHIHSFFHFFDMYLFVEDMNSHRTNFCTPLLVNAVLACAAAPLTGRNDNGHILGPTSLASHFYLEARKHWHAQEGQDSITRIQAAIILTYLLNQAGRDKVGMVFQQEALRIAHTLGLFNVEPPAYALIPPNGASVDNWIQHRSVTSWMLFNWQA
jgi:hypothetical protein